VAALANEVFLIDDVVRQPTTADESTIGINCRKLLAGRSIDDYIAMQTSADIGQHERTPVWLPRESGQRLVDSGSVEKGHLHQHHRHRERQLRSKPNIGQYVSEGCREPQHAGRRVLPR
jgi:hypothetical protein